MKLAWTLIGVLILVAASPAPASAVKVIAHSSVKVSQISPDELKGVFLETRTSLADGSHVEPVLLKSGDVHDAFVKQYTGKTAAGLENYYRSLVFTGKGRDAEDARVRRGSAGLCEEDQGSDRIRERRSEHRGREECSDVK